MAGLHDYPGLLDDIVRGNTIDFEIRLSDENGVIDITGSKFYLTFKTEVDPDLASTLEIIIDPDSIVAPLSDPTNGIAIGRITDSQTLGSFTPGFYYYSIRYITVDGHTYVIDMGKVKILECVSDRVE